MILGKTKGFRLKELTNYLERLHAPYEVVVRSEVQQRTNEKFGAVIKGIILT
jgi:N-formylglutamate amidohydrolase